MDNTAQWSILWSTALLPPQEMLPTGSIFYAVSANDTAFTNSGHLFGFSPCLPPPLLEREVVPLDEQDETDRKDNIGVDVAHEDFSALFAVEEFASYVYLM